VSTSLKLNTASDTASAQRVEREPEREAVHGCYRRLRFGSHEGGHALRARRGICPCAARARVGRHCGGVIQLAFRGGKGTEGSLWGDGRQGAHIPSTPARNHFTRRKIERHTRVRRGCLRCGQTRRHTRSGAYFVLFMSWPFNHPPTAPLVRSRVA
jgi:hypothetical protein